jgi:hypothetical protein
VEFAYLWFLDYPAAVIFVGQGQDYPRASEPTSNSRKEISSASTCLEDDPLSRELAAYVSMLNGSRHYCNTSQER